MPRIRHDQNFKLLLSEFFVEFIRLFFPSLIRHLDQSSIVFLDKEYFADKKFKHSGVSDLVVRAKVNNKENVFVVLLETQSKHDPEFPRRMFHYFSRLDKKYSLPIFPIVLLTYDQPKKTPRAGYIVEVVNKTFLRFNYEQVQLNRLKWQDYRNTRNPIAAALMSKMSIASSHRSRVRYECMNLLAGFDLPGEKREVIIWFVEQYLKARNASEKREYEQYMETMPRKKREVIMQKIEIFNSESRRKGLREGEKKGRRDTVLCLLTKRFGELDDAVNKEIFALSLKQLKQLSEDLLDFDSLVDVSAWLADKRSS